MDYLYTLLGLTTQTSVRSLVRGKDGNVALSLKRKSVPI